MTSIWVVALLPIGISFVQLVGVFAVVRWRVGRNEEDLRALTKHVAAMQRQVDENDGPRLKRIEDEIVRLRGRLHEVESYTAWMKYLDRKGMGDDR